MSAVRSALNVGGLTISTWVEQIRVDSVGPELDPAWTYDDEAGHRHWYDRLAVHGAPYPSLQEVIDGSYFCADCREDHETSHLECRSCGEHVMPGTRSVTTPRYIAGEKTITCEVDGSHWRITEAELGLIVWLGPQAGTAFVRARVSDARILNDGGNL